MDAAIVKYDYWGGNELKREIRVRFGLPTLFGLVNVYTFLKLCEAYYNAFLLLNF